jgi:ferric-dicitrate binding protein FerR (iron transport regulator)
VNSYAGEGAVKTTLLEGRVKVSNTDSEKVVLDPGQQAIAGSSDSGAAPQRLSVISGADLEKVMAWKNGLFNFEDANLQQVMRQLERWYDIDVVYEKGVPDIQFGGKISRNITLSNLLKVLARAEVKFRLEEGHRLVVLSK